MTAAEYHRIIEQARRDYELAQYIDNTARMIHEQSESLATIRNAWITSAPPLPGMTYEGTPDKWKPLLKS